MMYRGIHCLAAFVLLGTATSPGGEVFFRDGRTDWKVFVSPTADPTEVFAAEELRDALKKISGADFEVVSSGEAPPPHAIVVGDIENPAVRVKAAALKLRAGAVEEAAVATLDGRLYLAGNQPRGALYAVYSFLQNELGVRWLWPGPDGEFMPARNEWTLPELAFHHKPVFAYRGFHLCGDWRDVEMFREWMGRNFINLHRHAAPLQDKRRGFYSMWSSHNVTLPEALFDEHPEYFAEIGGNRYKNNICFSHPDVDRIVAAGLAGFVRQRPYVDILSIFPADNQDYCRCERCAKTDVSTAWFEFYNRLTDALKKDFPGLKFATIAYQGYRDVPRCAVRNSEFVEYASHGRCNIHPFEYPDCRLNENTLGAMRAWQATGTPMGHYSYEYDVFTGNCRFFPLLSIVEDAVRTSRRLGHAAVIPEVSLSPKTGPDVYAHHVQSRLSIYLYARLLWNPDQSMTDVLRDWCETAFGPAAEPMFDYYMAMDRAWTAMPIHATILGNALGAAPHLLTDELRSEAASAFADAERKLASIEQPAARERADAALRRERALYQQWVDLYRMNSDGPRIGLPLLEQAAGVAQSASAPAELVAATADASGPSASVRLAWTRDALLVRWLCRDRRTEGAKATGEREGNGADDRVVMELSSGLTGETWHFAVDANGARQTRRVSSVGVLEDRWEPPWEAVVARSADAWQADFTIPFASLGHAPNPNETWQARFVRRRGGPNGAAAAFPQRETALLLFTSAARTDRSLLWWSGAPDRERPRHAAIIQRFTEAGWQIRLIDGEDANHLLGQRYDAYWFRHPNGPNKVPAAFWQERLAPAVRDGALAVFVSYGTIPLDEYFQDPSLKVTTVSCGKVPLAGRTTAFIAPGDWSGKPHNLLGSLKEQITPAYGFAPADAGGWTILATAANGSDAPYPYLLVRRYGKGTIVLGGDDIRLPPAHVLENFVRFQEQATSAVENSPKE